VSFDPPQQGADAGAWPPDNDGSEPGPPNLSLVVGRDLGTVVVTVDGELSLASCQLLETVLTDLIEGQGNVAVAVDLATAIVEPNALMVFVDAARQARRRGTRFLLKEPSPDTHQALESAGYGELVEVLPRPTSDV